MKTKDIKCFTLLKSLKKNIMHYFGFKFQIQNPFSRVINIFTKLDINI